MFPLETSQTMANPAIHVPQPRRRLAQAKVAKPPLQVLTKGGEDLSQASALVASRQLFNPSVEPRESLWSHLAPVRRFPPSEAAPQKTAVLRAIHGTLAPVPLHLEATGDAPTDAGHPSVTGSCTAPRDIALIGVATEPMPSSLKLLVQLV